jgi:hypothetical protein
MVLIMSQNGEGPLDHGPETALIDQSAKPLRSPAGDTRKFEAFDARKSKRSVLALPSQEEAKRGRFAYAAESFVCSTSGNFRTL